MNTRLMQRQQLNDKMLYFKSLRQLAPPLNGWVNAIRTSLGMSMEQLGNKLSIKKQSVQDLERREKDGAITLKSLREAAAALDMQLVYALVPTDSSLEALIERKAKELATQIVIRTSNSMKLEDQENTKERIEKAIRERALTIKNEMPKSLWD